MRALVLIASLVPFVLFAGRDMAYHLRDRKPSLLESLVHLGLGAAQVTLVVAAFREQGGRLALAAVAVGVLGAVDEYAFHRDLPARESDLHAKAHFALFAFTAVAAALAAFPDVAALRRAVQP